jgi:hypothetical protein
MRSRAHVSTYLSFIPQAFISQKLIAIEFQFKDDGHLANLECRKLQSSLGTFFVCNQSDSNVGIAGSICRRFGNEQIVRSWMDEAGSQFDLEDILVMAEALNLRSLHFRDHRNSPVLHSNAFLMMQLNRFKS